MGPSPGNVPRATPRLIPAEWRTDQQTLHDRLLDLCLELLRNDADERVREYALLAIGNLEVPLNPRQPIREEFVSLLIDLYRHDANDRIRAEVIKSFRLVSNNSDRVRIVLRDALIDRAAGVRREALTAITPEAVGGVPKLPFGEASSTIPAGIKQGDRAVRLGAVRALNLFGASAREQLPFLQQLTASDPDTGVRDAARLAIEAIRRDLIRTTTAGAGNAR